MRPVTRNQPSSTHRPGRRTSRQAGLVAAVTAAALAVTGWAATSSSAAPADDAHDARPAGRPAPHEPGPTPDGPLLTPGDGAFLEGSVAVAAEPVAPGDDVARLTVDGAPVPGATETLGTSVLGFQVGSNSVEARYGSTVSVNGAAPIPLPDAVSERVELEVPNEQLRAGENTVEVVVGAIETSCGSNHDDFVLSDFTLEPLGEIADGEENEYTYAFGDGSCGSNTSLLLRAELTFFVQGDPQGTTGLRAELDTTTLTNGAHTLEARTASGDRTRHTVRVNNAPAGAPRLTPVDGTLTTGAVVVTGARPADGEGGTAGLAVDGEPLDATQTLGTGDATFSFDVGSNSVDGRAANLLVVNGIETPLGGSYASERADVVFPNEWLRPGENTVRVVTGAFADDCNRDDFTISALALAPAAGTAAGVDLEPTYRMGDGTCGSNETLLREITLTFDVDAPARGLRADLDTADLRDGEHELTATSTTGETAARTLVTDNTGPALTRVTPARGTRLTAAVPLDVAVDDASGVVEGPAVTLDGEEITPGDPVGPGLSAGRHTIEVTATDGLGNAATHEVTFVSVGIPDVPTEVAPASGTSDVGRTATLRAKVTEPDGGRLTARFSAAEILTPKRAWEGTATEVPTTLYPRGQRKIGTTALAPGDGRSEEAPASADVTYQRFDVPVHGTVDAPVLRWEGTADPARLVTLRAWNPRTDAWDVVASARGAVDGPTVLEGTVDRGHVDRGAVHAMVTGEDPFADDLAAGDGDRFEDPEDYDFSIVHYTDTQYLSEGAVEQETPEERAVWAQGYEGVMNWIVDNADERKIAYVAHTGDIIENNIRAFPPEMEDQVIGELEFASQAQGRIDAAGIPNGVVAGNHDNQSGTDPTLYDRYFGPDRYEALSEGWEDASYGGVMEPGSNENHYDLFSAGGLDFVVVGLSYGVTRDEAEWAASIFERYPDRNGILLTHDYLEPSSSPDGRGAAFGGSDGPLLYNLLVKDNPNVFLVLAGHRHGVGTNVRPPVVGDIGGGVVELLADYQFYTVSAGRLGLDRIGGYDPADQLQFGASFFRMLQFDVDRGEMSVDTYSPLLGEFGATEYDTEHRYDGREDDMVLPVDLTSRTTSFTTDAVVLYDPSHQIGQDVAASGRTASVRWTGLKPGRTYAWFVTARTSGGGTATASPAYFTTARR